MVKLLGSRKNVRLIVAFVRRNFIAFSFFSFSSIKNFPWRLGCCRRTSVTRVQNWAANSSGLLSCAVRVCEHRRVKHNSLCFCHRGDIRRTITGERRSSPLWDVWSKKGKFLCHKFSNCAALRRCFAEANRPVWVVSSPQSRSSVKMCVYCTEAVSRRWLLKPSKVTGEGDPTPHVIIFGIVSLQQLLTTYWDSLASNHD